MKIKLPFSPNPKSQSKILIVVAAAIPSQSIACLQRAAELLKNWLAFADKLPVHDLLDRIYFEGDVLARYSAVLPPEMRAKVAANLHAFMEIALSVDAGATPACRASCRSCANCATARTMRRTKAGSARRAMRYASTPCTSRRGWKRHRLPAGRERGEEQPGRQRRAARLADA